MQTLRALLALLLGAQGERHPRAYWMVEGVERRREQR
jgi:hypothetical protein